MHWISKFITGFLLLGWVRCNDPPLNLHSSIVEYLSKNDTSSGLTSHLLKGQCNLLPLKDGQILRLLLNKKQYKLFKSLFEYRCSMTTDLFMIYVKIVLESKSIKNQSMLRIIYERAQKTHRYLGLYQHVFAECAYNQNYKCLDWFESEICRLISSGKENILHFAAGLDDNKLFSIAERCTMLIDKTNVQRQYPMDLVQSRKMAIKFNEKWLQVSRERFLSLASSESRLNLCHRFELSDECENLNPPARGQMLKETFLEGINESTDLYCPYLRMKINLLEVYGQIPVLEWLSFLLTDIFVPASGNGNVEEYSLPLFEYCESEGAYVPNGLYPGEVYELAGKVFSIANYFGLGLGNKVVQSTQGTDAQRSSFEYFKRGMDELRFMKIEVHSNAQNDDRIVLKSKNQLFQIKISEKTTSGKISRNAKMLVKAFEELSGAKQRKFIDSIPDKRENIIKITIKETENPEPGNKANRIITDSSEFEITSDATIEDYKAKLEKVSS